MILTHHIASCVCVCADDAGGMTAACTLVLLLLSLCVYVFEQGLVKIGSDLYKTILPMVKTQVESQIKVRDFTSAKLSIEPADAASWSDVRTQLITEAKDRLRSELELELAGATGEAALEEIRTSFARRERLIEHTVDTTPHTFTATIDADYNFLAK